MSVRLSSPVCRCAPSRSGSTSSPASARRSRASSSPRPLTSASPTAGNTYELTAIAAVVIGGASLMGGRGNVRGTLLGAFVIGFLSDGLVIVGVSAYWQMVFIGAVIVVAVLLNSLQYGRRRRPAASVAQPAKSADKTPEPAGTN
ncbi:ABC transporter permease [Microbacterium murale]|uniref:ABC transporter permease n=1 Tax=Microbacterium murale TaxID=1081040 RepID=UPI0027D88E79|nr:ABC transporter permease [Microbacterium murale]